MSARRALALAVALAACGADARDVRRPGPARPLPPHDELVLDGRPPPRRRMVPPEAFLRAYLGWFGGLAPEEVPRRAHGFGLFDQWTDYLAALGLPSYRLDVPRQDRSNPMMLAALGRLGEALCVRAVEHDLRAGAPAAARLVFAFDAPPAPSPEAFAAGFDVLHRTFLGYPAALAPAGRAARFLALYRAVAARHPGRAPLTADEAAWAAVCAALLQHPEAGLY